MQGAGDASSNLRPGWNRSSGGGFQPPPPAEEDEQQPQTRPRMNTSRGRSLADLARTSVPGTNPIATSNNGTSSSLRWPTQSSSSGAHHQPKTSSAPVTSGGPRYTREKLLSLRAPTNSTPPGALPPEICSEEAQDPVCWDTLDADTIWGNNAIRLRKSSAERSARTSTRDRGGDVSTSSARWQRGVALPAAAAAVTSSTTSKHATAAEDLWDDPDDELDFAKMAEASAQMEHELRGTKEQDEEPEIEEDEPKGGGAFISRNAIGSGDHVNVFEEEAQAATAESSATVVSVEEPEPTPPAQPEPVIHKAGSDGGVDESSRLMAMIGVSKPTAEEASLWGSASAAVPLNPWGAPPSSTSNNDAAAASAAAEQQRLKRQAEEEQQRQEILRMEQEQARRQEHARLEREQRARREQEQHAAAQAAAAAANPSEVELVLMERISTILESQWGHSDLVSILSLLHAEDSRVIALLGSVDALRALIQRHPRRVEIRLDPARRAEIAQLLLTNAQYRQEQENQRRDQLMQEELQRRRMMAEQEQKRLQQRQMQMSAPSPPAMPPIDANMPWYYSDPSRNIQGPFRAEEMRQWLEAGYFKGDLPISQNTTGPFAPLSNYFPNMASAFKEEAPAPAMSDPRHSVVEERSVPEPVPDRNLTPTQQPVQTLGSASVEESVSVVEEPTPQPPSPEQSEPKNEGDYENENNSNNASSSDQLKMMLGLGNGSGNGSKAPTPAPAPTAQQKKASAWGSSTKPTARKSMSEIQQEEAAAAAKRGGNNNSGSAGWAKVAAKPTVWTGAAVAPANAATMKPTPRPGNGPTRSASLAVHHQPPPSLRPQKPSRSKSTADAADFGAKLPRGLEDWAKEQMVRLNGSEDLTLVSFCMSLQDPEEIHQYLAAYLGLSKEVSQFANELIARKADDWESTARKGRKNKSGR